MPKGYTNKALVQNYLLTEIGDSFNDQVDDWIKAVEVYIDRFTNRPFLVDSGDTVPADIIYAATVLVAGIVSTNKAKAAASGSTGGDITSISIGRYSVSYGSTASAADKQLTADIMNAMDIIKSYKIYKF